MPSPHSILGHAPAQQPQTIANIMAQSERPDVISLAGGFPSPQAQDWQGLRDLTEQCLAKTPTGAFGYGPTAGLTVLRETIAQRMSDQGRPTRTEDVLITAGGISGLDLFASTLCGPGDTVVVGRPAYFGAIQVFRRHDLRLCEVPVGADGWDLHALRRAFLQARAEGSRAAAIYLVPSHDNPTGLTLSGQQREQILALADEFGAWVVEDGTYQELSFDHSPPPMMAALAPSSVIHVNTFSKTLCPGFRLGWIAAPGAATAQLTARKQCWDQCAAMFGQHVVLEAMDNGYFERSIRRARKVYEQRCGAMLDGLQECLTDAADWVHPEGGFFIWVRLREGLSSAALAECLIRQHRVAILPGADFYASAPPDDTLRLAYSCAQQSQIRHAIAALGSVAHAAQSAAGTASRTVLRSH